MKHSTETRTTVRRDNTAWEIRQIQALNADRNRLYPEFDRNPQSYRVQIVLDALPRVENTFAFIRQATHLARIIHNSNSARFEHSLNRAMRMITNAAAAPGLPRVAARVAA